MACRMVMSEHANGYCDMDETLVYLISLAFLWQSCLELIASALWRRGHLFLFLLHHQFGIALSRRFLFPLHEHCIYVDEDCLLFRLHGLHSTMFSFILPFCTVAGSSQRTIVVDKTTELLLSCATPGGRRICLEDHFGLDNDEYGEQASVYIHTAAF